MVAVSASTPGNPSAANATLWTLPASVAAGQVLYRTDNVANNYWGSDIAWSPGGSGWVMIVDDQGKVVDFTAWGYTQAEIASLATHGQRPCHWRRGSDHGGRLRV